MATPSAGPGSGSRWQWSPDGAYVLNGDVLEARDPTPIPAPPAAGAPALRSVAAWRIRSGRINSVDVSGQIVVVVTSPPRGTPTGPVVRVILLEERANPEQILALLDAFRGRLGGPLAELARPGTEDRGFAQVPIDYQLWPEGGSVSVPDRLRLVVHLDPPGRSGRASEMSLELLDRCLAWHGGNPPAAYREFSLRSQPDNVRPNHLSMEEDTMGTTTPDEMDRIIDQHFASEAAHDIEGVMATFAEDAQLDLVGYPAGPLHGTQQIRDFYEQLFKLIDQEEAQPLRRYYGQDLMVDETTWSGQFDGVLVGAEGHRGPVNFRILHVLEFRDGRVARENVWLDSDAIRRQLLGDGV